MKYEFMDFSEVILKRFWRKVVRKTDQECWLWTGSKNSKGYGYFHGGNGIKKAHRFACYIYNGKPSNTKLQAMHSCDNPSCVNPKHLRWGTNQENNIDCREKGRNPKCQITSLQVSYIKSLLFAGYRYKEIAEWYCVPKDTIKGINTRMSWKDVPPYINSGNS